MTTDASITVGIKGDTRGGKRVKRNLDDIRQSSRKTIGTQRRLETQFQRTQRAASRLKAGVAGATAALGGFAFAANRSLDTATRIKQLANTAGVGVERFQEFAFVVRQTGGNMSDTAELLKELQNRLAEFAREDKGTASDILKSVGISQERVKAAQGNVDELINIAVDGFKRIETASERTFFLEEVLGGQAGERAREFFQRLAREGIEPATREARRLNQVIGEDTINNADKLNDAFGNLRVSIRNSFAKGLVREFSGEFDNFAQAANDPQLNNSIESLGENVGELAKNLGTVVDLINTLPAISDRIGKELRNRAQNFGLAPTPAIQRLQEINRQIQAEKSLAGSPEGFLGTISNPRRALQEPDPERLQSLKAEKRELRKQLGLIKEQNKELEIGRGLIDLPRAPDRGLSLTVRKSPSLRDQIANAPGAFSPESTRAQLAQGGNLIPGSAFEKLPDLFENSESKASALKDELRGVRNEVDRFANSTAQTFSRFISGATSAQEALRGLLQDLQQLIIRQTVTQPLKNSLSSAISGGFGGLFGGGSSLKSGAVGLASGGGLFNFAQGGSFTVGGRSGVDNNRLSLNGQPVANVSKGERVSVSPKNKGGQTIINADMRGASVEAVQRLEQFVANLDASLEPRAISATQGQFERNPEFMR